MSAAASSPGQTAARWLRRGARAVVGLAVDALVESLALGRRALGWLSHAATTRTLVVVALGLALVGGALWAARVAPRSARALVDDTTQTDDA